MTQLNTQNMARKTNKTNRQVLMNMIKNMDEMHLIFVRERLLMVSENVLNQKEAVYEDMKNSFVHPQLYIDAMQAIHDAIKFDD
jgi:hypothetical protein